MEDINQYISVKLDDNFDQNLASDHHQVIVGLLSNNNVVQSEERDISHFIFMNEEKGILSSEYIRKHTKMIPTKVIEEYTDLRSNEETEEQVVVFLPIVYHLHSANCQSYRTILQYLLKCLMEADYMAIKESCGIFQFDQAIENLFQLEKKFWDQNKDKFTVSVIERENPWGIMKYNKYNHKGLDWFLSRRFKNSYYKSVDDFTLISKINDDEFVLDDTQKDGWYDTGVKPDETFEKSTAYQIWKESIPFEPLPIEEYNNHLTYHETELLFQLAERFSPELFYKLCILFLGSYQLCHLIILNESCSGLIMNKFQQLEDQYQLDWWKSLFKGYYFESGKYHPGDHVVHQIYNQMARILYYEERLLAGNITTEHRSMIPISFASNLRNPDGVSDFWIHNDRNYFFPFPAKTCINYNTPPNQLRVHQKIVDYTTFLNRFQKISNGILDGLDWKGLNVFFTGAMAELCYYNNTIFEFDDLNSNAYAGSDFDLAIKIDPEELGITESFKEQPGNNDLIKAELRRRAEMIYEVVAQNTGLTDLEMIPRNNRWIISHSKLPREIDIFSFIQDPAALIYNYHMPTCRVIAQPISMNGTDITPVKLLSSSCLSAMMGTGIDRRWYSSTYSIHQRIIKQFQRGIGMIMNPHETKVIIQYLMEYRKSNPDEKKNAILNEHSFEEEDFNNIELFFSPNEELSYWRQNQSTASIFKQIDN